MILADRTRFAETTDRFDRRVQQREITLTKLRTGNVLGADTARRVQARLERLARSPEAARTLNEISREISAAPSDVTNPAWKRLAQERLIGTSDLMSVAYLERAASVARSVARVHIQDGSRFVGWGTAFLVAPRLVLTNRHVLDSERIAASSLVEFDYRTDANNPVRSFIYELDPGTLYLADERLDYALVAVRDRSGEPLSAFPWNALIGEEGKAILGEYLNVIQHPGGGTKQLVLRENRVVDIFDDFIHYLADTEGGSSGSPAFNDQWEVVALHHSGVPKIDRQGNVLAAGGGIWTEGMGEDRVDWIANEGVRVSSIVRHLKARFPNLSAAARGLTEGMFVSSPVGTVPVLSNPTQREVSSVPTAEGNYFTCTLNVPIEVAVRLGSPGSLASPPTQRSAQGSVFIPNNGSLTIRPVEEPATGELAESLRTLESARTRIYYDALEDARERNAYYTGVDPSADPTAFYRKLRDLLERTHTARLSYSPSAHVYPWVDLQPNLKLRSVYSGIEYDAESFIRDDFETTRRLGVRVREMLAAESEATPELVRERLDALEAGMPFNCEHVVPQSWFSKREPMRGDLHHLFACEVNCNSFRSNIPYYEFLDFEEAIRQDCGKREERKFEPGSGKGEVARATLYFLLRYPGQIDRNENEYREERLRILFDWHRQHPVTQHERHRNRAIFEKQGNRNPLIDHPEWMERINFALGLA